MAANALEEEVDNERGNVAALAVQQRRGGIFMYVLRDTRVDAAARNGQALPAIAVDEVQLLRFAVPEVLRISELRGVVPEILQEIVARSDGDDGHRRIFKARDAVCDLVNCSVAAAGIEAHTSALGGDAARQRRAVARRLGEHALDVKTVVPPQRLRHLIDALAAVCLAGGGVDDEDMLHGSIPPKIFLC